jgi:hypothetical protein
VTERRRILEPKTIFDRILYAALALNGPLTAIFSLKSDDRDLQFAGLIMAIWSAIATFYTIDWALTSYRSWRRRLQCRK